MRRSTLGGAPRQLASAVVLLAPLFAAGCTLVQPGCRNRDVTASIEKGARESLELTRSMSGLADLSADTAFSLTDQVEVSRQDTTSSCTANVSISIGSQSVSVPIEYEVVAGADGEAYYR